jgi:hypothetical protein
LDFASHDDRQRSSPMDLEAIIAFQPRSGKAVHQSIHDGRSFTAVGKREPAADEKGLRLFPGHTSCAAYPTAREREAYPFRSPRFPDKVVCFPKDNFYVSCLSLHFTTSPLLVAQESVREASRKQKSAPRAGHPSASPTTPFFIHLRIQRSSALATARYAAFGDMVSSNRPGRCGC